MTEPPAPLVVNNVVFMRVIMPSRPNTFGFPTALILVFLLFAAAIGFTGYRYYSSQKEQIISEKYQELSAIADLKAAQIVKWRAERLDDDLRFLNNPAFAASVMRFLANTESAGYRREVVRWLIPISDNCCYHSIVIFDRGMKEKLTLGNDNGAVGQRTRALAFSAMESGKTMISDLHYGDHIGHIHMDVLIPLRLPDLSRPVATMLVRVDPYTELYPLVQSWPTPSRTAETLMVRREGEDVVYLNELRHRKGTALSLHMPLNRRELPSVNAAFGNEGTFRGVDYRGLPVFSVARRISGAPWFLEAKIDEEEILVPVLERARVTGLIVGFLILLSGMGVVLFWRHGSARLYKRLYKEECAHRRLEQDVRLNEARLQSLYNISQYHAADVQDLLDFALAEALSLTGSQFGYIYFYDEDTKLFTLNSWSNGVMKECAVVEPQTVYELERTGIWGEAVRQRRPIMLNDFPVANPLKKGYPPGHVELFTYLTIPVFSKEKIVAVVGIANKEGAYDETDIRQLTLLSDSVWKYVERKRIEDELIRLNKELETRVLERTEDLEAFTYSVSHDLRAPLRAIGGFTRIIRDDYSDSLDDEGRRLLQVVLDNTDRMGQLIEDLLAFSRLGRSEVNRKSVDMTRLASAVLDEYLAGEPGARLKCRLSALPEAVGDPSMLRQVWVNLISNAIKFTLPKGQGTLEVSGSADSGETIYSVRDTGIGFDMANSGKLFGIFQRLHSATEFEGNGVGLAIVQRIVERHGGRVWAEGKPGEGAEFYFSLPASKDGEGLVSIPSQ